MKESVLNEEIFSRYGSVTRARGCFLYTKKTVRLTDMYQAGGRAILGWGGENPFTRFKNIMNRGLTGSFITEYTAQIDRAVSELLDFSASQATQCNDSFEYKKENVKKEIVSQSDDQKDFSSGAANGTLATKTGFFEPSDVENGGQNKKNVVRYKTYFFRDKESAIKSGLQIAPENTNVWMPWRNSKFRNDCLNEAVVMIPPLPWGNDVFILATPLDVQPPKETVCLPSPLVAAITRSIYDLISAMKTRKEKDWFIYDTVLTKYFLRKGPYLYPKVSENRYDDFVKFCLDAEIVISPFYNAPSIVPFGADKGVFTKLKNATQSDYEAYWGIEGQF